MPLGNGKIICVKFIPPFMKNGRSCKSWDEISIRGRGYNTLVLSFAFGICILWAQASSKHSWTWAYEISSHSYTLSHQMLIIYIYMLMLVIMYDQCMRWLWGHENTLDTSRMIKGIMFVFMAKDKFASKCWFHLKCHFHDAGLTKVEQ